MTKPFCQLECGRFARGARAEEQRIYERTRKELEADASPAFRAERNAALRNLGLRTIPAPKKGK